MGFEPTKRFHVYTLSKRAPSATRTPLQRKDGKILLKSPHSLQAFSLAKIPWVGKNGSTPHIGAILMRKYLFFIPLLALLLSSCWKEKKSACDVLVSIPPYIYFVNELTNGELKAISIVPEGASPHFYEPTPKEVLSMQSAKAWIRMGEQFEDKIAASLTERNKNLVMVNLAEKLPLRREGSCSCCHHAADLHFWLSPRLAKIQAEEIAKTIALAFPERACQVERNLPLLLGKLSSLDEVLREKLTPCAGEALLVSHPAFGYFCADYHLEQLSIEQEGKDPLPRQISYILETARSTHIRAILTQAQYSNKGALRISDELGIKTKEIDPYSPNYEETLFTLASYIAEP